MYFTLKIISINSAYFSKVSQSSSISILLSSLNRYLGHSAKNSYFKVHSSSAPKHTTAWEGFCCFLHMHRSHGSATAINLSMLFNNEPLMLKRLHILSLFSSFWTFSKGLLLTKLLCTTVSFSSGFQLQSSYPSFSIQSVSTISPSTSSSPLSSSIWATTFISKYSYPTGGTGKMSSFRR